MFKMKMILLYFLAGAFISCQKNPLEDVPESLQKGSFKTGPDNFADFEDIIVDKFLKVDVLKNSGNFILTFQEGTFRSYKIKFRLLGDLKSKYEIIIKDNPFLKLKDSEWSYDSETQIGVLNWKPGNNFNFRSSFVHDSIPLYIQLKKLGEPNRGSASVVTRQLEVVVYKNYQAPEVDKIETKYANFIKLDDGKFYKDYSLSSLDLTYYDLVFLGYEKRIEVDDSFMFYTSYIQNQFNSISSYDDPSTERVGFKKDYDFFMMTDKRREQVPEDLLPFIGEPYYKVVTKDEGGDYCEKTIPADLEASLCLVPVTQRNAIPLETDLYVKQYDIPNDVQISDLYYRLESKALCEIYYHGLGADYLILKKTWNTYVKEAQSICYLSFEKLNKNKPIPITERAEIYIVKKSGEGLSAVSVDKSDWKERFYRLSRALKWQLAGLHPLDKDVIPINLSRLGKELSLSFYVQDNNHLPIYFTPVKEFYKSPSWALPFAWKFKDKKRVENNLWKLTYSFKLNDSEIKKESVGSKEENYYLILQPFSANVGGEAIKFKFSVLPFIPSHTIESFNPEKDFLISTEIKKTGDFQDWVETQLSIKTQIKHEYVFSDELKKTLLKILSKEKMESQMNLMDIFDIQPLNPKFTVKNESHSICRDKSYFQNTSCKCTDFTLNERSAELNEKDSSQEDKITYIESVCSYETTLTLQNTTFNKAKGISSAYWKYNYYISPEILLKNEFYGDGTNQTSIPLPIKRTYSNKYPLASDLNNPFDIHFFFNLKPKISCFLEEFDSLNQTCKVSYFLDISPEKSVLFNLNKDEYFFSDKGLQAEVSCLKSDQNKNDISTCLEETGMFEQCLNSYSKNIDTENIESCSCTKPQFVIREKKIGTDRYRTPGGAQTVDITKSNVSLEVICSMDRGEKGFIETVLKTESHYIYFLNKQPQTSAVKNKSTSVEKLEIKLQ